MAPRGMFPQNLDSPLLPRQRSVPTLHRPSCNRCPTRPLIELPSPVPGVSRDRPRFLSPRECARLMGFPEHFALPDPRGTGIAGLKLWISCRLLASCAVILSRAYSQQSAARRARCCLCCC